MGPRVSATVTRWSNARCSLRGEEEKEEGARRKRCSHGSESELNPSGIVAACLRGSSGPERSIAIRPKASFVPATFPVNFSFSLSLSLALSFGRSLARSRSRRRSRKFRTAVVLGHDKPPSGRDDPLLWKQRNLPDEEPAHYLAATIRRNITGAEAFSARLLIIRPPACAHTGRAVVATKRERNHRSLRKKPRFIYERVLLGNQWNRWMYIRRSFVPSLGLCSFLVNTRCCFDHLPLCINPLEPCVIGISSLIKRDS